MPGLSKQNAILVELRAYTDKKLPNFVVSEHHCVILVDRVVVMIHHSQHMDAVREKGLSALDGQVYRLYKAEGYISTLYELWPYDPGVDGMSNQGTGSFVVYPDHIYASAAA